MRASKNQAAVPFTSHLCSTQCLLTLLDMHYQGGKLWKMAPSFLLEALLQDDRFFPQKLSSPGSHSKLSLFRFPVTFGIWFFILFPGSSFRDLYFLMFSGFCLRPLFFLAWHFPLGDPIYSYGFKYHPGFI